MLCTFCPPTILGDLYRIPEEKLPKIIGGQDVQSMRDKRSDPQRLELYIFQNVMIPACIRKRQFVHKMFVHTIFVPLDPPLPTSKVMDFLLIFY